MTKKTTVVDLQVDLSELKEAKLTPLQHRFVMKYIQSGNAAKAAEEAGCKGNKNSWKTQGYQLLQFPHVQVAIREAQGKITEKAALTRDDVIRHFLDTADEARRAKKFDAAVKSYEKIAELYGYLKKTTKKEEEQAEKNKPVGNEAFITEGEDGMNDINETIGNLFKMMDKKNMKSA